MKTLQWLSQTTTLHAVKPLSLSICTSYCAVSMVSLSACTISNPHHTTITNRMTWPSHCNARGTMTPTYKHTISLIIYLCMSVQLIVHTGYSFLSLAAQYSPGSQLHEAWLFPLPSLTDRWSLFCPYPPSFTNPPTASFSIVNTYQLLSIPFKLLDSWPFPGLQIHNNI